MKAYIHDDFKRCMYNPLEDNLGAAYPKLIEIFGALTPEVIRILRYAMACYDPGSPIVKDQPELLQRKMAAATVAGFDIETEEKYLAEVFAGVNEQAVEIIHDYLRRCIRSREWAMIVSNEETFWEYNGRLKTPIRVIEDKEMITAIDKKSKLSADQEVIHERIKRYEKEFYGGDQELQEAVEKARGLNPQKIAKQLSGNKDV